MNDAAALDAQQEKRALQSLLTISEKQIVPAVDAMPADKFGFARQVGAFVCQRHNICSLRCRW
jgi:folate-dependent tRNA-U54 methylase TrmFO/GidA